MTERRNKNRGYKKLRVWQDAVELYVLSDEILLKLPYIYRKSISNALDACLSISRNIAEVYCRKGIKEYLNFLNISISSAGEFHSVVFTFFKANKLDESDFEKLDSLVFKIENQLIRLIESLQEKRESGNWEESYL